MAKALNLRIPGPTPLPDEVIRATGSQMINHRAKDYEEIQARVINNLRYFFQTENEIFLLTSSGMGGLEAALVNFFSPGDKLIFFTCGEFGNRWAEIGRRFALNVEQVAFPSGKAVDKDEVYQVLEQNDDIKGVAITHNETASGVLNDIESIAPFVKDHKNKPLLMIDSISALGAVDLPMDKLGIDVLVTASQKAWMAPPGLSMISASKKAWDRHLNAKLPRYYFDLTMYKEFNQKNQTPATPAIASIFGLDASLKLMRREGRENIFARHLKLRDFLRKKIKTIGLSLFVADVAASPTVTSIVIPENRDTHEWLKVLREKYGLVLAGGMGDTKGKIIRVAHMGHISQKELDEVIAALKETLAS